MRHLLLIAVCSAICFAADPAPASSGTAAAPAVSSGPLSFTLKANDGKDYPLSQHLGKVVLLVNTASKCGLTPQYAPLQALHAKYAGKGLVIIGIPANEFGKQEPGSDAEIRQFCTDRFQVSFPLMAKTVVKGEGISPLYQWLTTASPKPGPIAWNFTKFLVGRDGTLIDRFEPRTKPDDAQVVAAIEKALAAPAQ